MSLSLWTTEMSTEVLKWRTDMTKHGFRVTIQLQGGQAEVGENRVIPSSLLPPPPLPELGTGHSA